MKKIVLPVFLFWFSSFYVLTYYTLYWEQQMVLVWNKIFCYNEQFFFIQGRSIGAMHSRNIVGTQRKLIYSREAILFSVFIFLRILTLMIQWRVRCWSERIYSKLIVINRYLILNWKIYEYFTRTQQISWSRFRLLTPTYHRM